MGVPRRRRRGDRGRRRARSPIESPTRCASRPVGVAYAHGSAFTSEALEAYAAASGSAPAARRPRDLPGVGRVGGDRDRAQARPGISPRPGRGHRSIVIARWGSYHGNTSAPSTCPAASRCAGPTRVARPVPTRQRGVSLSCRRPRSRRARRRPRSSPPSSSGASRPAGPGTVAAFVAEPIVGATLAGAVPPDGYWQAIAEVCRRHGVLLIADEVMTGFGRTGRWFGLDHWSIRPDSWWRPRARPRATGRSGSSRRRAGVRDGHGSPAPGSSMASPTATTSSGRRWPREVLRILEAEALVEASAAKGERLRGLLDRPPRRPPERRRDPRSRTAHRPRARGGSRARGAVPAEPAADRGDRPGPPGPMGCSCTAAPGWRTASTATPSCSDRRSS